MYAAKDEPSFLVTVSLTPDAFEDLLTQFKHSYVVLSHPFRGGRPPRIPHKHAVLAMVLHFYTAALESKTLQKLFGLSATTFSRVLHKAEEALSVALKAMKDARIFTLFLDPLIFDEEVTNIVGFTVVFIS
ncbi:hypothetical protein H310_14975 [Aphanomyces invadans]|uniref:Transposase Helix-turn-helix domain-containing protein n=1 Tax=Aphanomyces invadans TaxID=157072 RepID=A0A024T881_9STRA|nr:hypothetical protein H310_14975 [Aphanomyces invadans]ETV90193.1 hypothetical protein H310_14975 [Aphanomyces invadans]|eukprot:XP_008881177.1 hypothetical protein H310_14975 [Aphanomyces invadans]